VINLSASWVESSCIRCSKGLDLNCSGVTRTVTGGVGVESGTNVVLVSGVFTFDYLSCVIWAGCEGVYANSYVVVNLRLRDQLVIELIAAAFKHEHKQVFVDDLFFTDEFTFAVDRFVSGGEC